MINEILNDEKYIKVNKHIEKFVADKLENHIILKTGKKTIHDAVWGSVVFEPWEVQIIDTPLFQRLRNIKQVGLAVLTYPSAHHSRFEHSLGVVAAAEKMCAMVNVNMKKEENDEDFINHECRCKIRLAALLHDIGHCFFSHLSEKIYGEIEEVHKLKIFIKQKLGPKAKPHELVSFMIVNSEYFKKYFLQNIDYPKKYLNNVDKLMFEIGQMIIGSQIKADNKILSYQTAIINGSFDADKLDYIKRDSQTAGISLIYDLDRLFNKIEVFTLKNGTHEEQRLVVNFNGVTAIEEITFCKIMLHSYIYYHHKVLITDYMIKDYIYALMDIKDINNLYDFLSYDDNEILNINVVKEEYVLYKDQAIKLKDLAKRIKKRVLPKRCFEISQNNVKYKESIDEIKKKNNEIIYEKLKEKFSDPNYDLINFESDFETLTADMLGVGKPKIVSWVDKIADKNYNELLDIRYAIFELLKTEYEKLKKTVNFNLYDIYVVFPLTVSYGIGDEKIILSKDKKGLLKVNDFIKLNDWADSFNSNKWRGYVFVSEKVDSTIARNVVTNYIFENNEATNDNKIIAIEYK